MEENLFGTVKVTLARPPGAAATRRQGPGPAWSGQSQHWARHPASRMETGGFREPAAEPSGLVGPGFGVLTVFTQRMWEWRRVRT